ncbi:MAG: aminoacyl-tRNA hydrolase [Pycnora praestabilis]|nr:MAG: aminoacyl-tRNA hydrolase [Pycnora praestabilis]
MPLPQVASIGNPPPLYTHTLHSAGHTLLSHLRLLLSYPPFIKSRLYANGLVSEDPFSSEFTLWQSPSLMNVSGAGVAKAWTKYKAGLSSEEGGRARLVVLHDELEEGKVGRVRARRGGSARGHNGIKSILAAMPKDEFTRVAIGIGRPESREPVDVARYVLKKMTLGERAKIEDAAGQVLGILREISEEV